jgi:hypothetical protein
MWNSRSATSSGCSDGDRTAQSRRRSSGGGDNLQVGASKAQQHVAASIAYLKKMMQRAIGKCGVPHKLARDKPRLVESSLFVRELLTDAVPADFLPLNDVKEISGHRTVPTLLTIPQTINRCLKSTSACRLSSRPEAFPLLVFLKS